MVWLAIIATVCFAVFFIRVIRHEANLAAAVHGMAAVPDMQEGAVTWPNYEAYDSEMRGINPDYVGLLIIDGTAISYPVVRGSDNVKYLSTTYAGIENPFGGLFMDYRCTGENRPHIIIYGHNIMDVYGNSHYFGGLDAFLEEGFMAEHPVITLVEGGFVSEFEIFSARLTDTGDPAYHLNFNAPGSFDSFLERNGAPPDAQQILTLSTCYGAGVDEMRVIIQGMRRSIIPIDGGQVVIGINK